MTTPLLLPPFFSSLNRFFIFPSITWHPTERTPARAVEGLLDLPEDDDLHYAWVSRQNPYSGEPISCFHCGACCMLQVYGVIMGLNIFCDPF